MYSLALINEGDLISTFESSPSPKTFISCVVMLDSLKLLGG